jgi:hypothetical protein
VVVNLPNRSALRFLLPEVFAASVEILVAMRVVPNDTGDNWKGKSYEGKDDAEAAQEWGPFLYDQSKSWKC